MSRLRFLRARTKTAHFAPVLMSSALAILLTGCSILPKAQTITIFTPHAQASADPAWPNVRWQLQIARPHADAALDSARILVRPQPGEVQVYKGAAWSQPAPDLVLDALLRAFTDSGRVPGVARRGEGVNAEYELLLDLRRFESAYLDAEHPQARIELGARLVDNAANRVVAHRVFTIERAIDGTDINTVTHALDAALTDTCTQVVGWVLETGRHNTR